MTDLSHTLILGGSSGMGLALAARLLAAGEEVTIAGRSPQRLAAAADTLAAPDRLHTVSADITGEDSVRRLFDGLDRLDHVVVTAVDITGGGYLPIREMTWAAAQSLFAVKLLGPILVARHAAAHLPPHGSYTVTSGIAGYRPGPGGTLVAAANTGLEGMVRALALELAPVRVNAVSPGWIDTPVWDELAGPAKHERLAAMAARLPAGRIGHPDDIAAAFQAIMTNGFITGSVVHVDGGHRLV